MLDAQTIQDAAYDHAKSLNAQLDDLSHWIRQAGELQAAARFMEIGLKNGYGRLESAEAATEDLRALKIALQKAR